MINTYHVRKPLSTALRGNQWDHETPWLYGTRARERNTFLFGPIANKEELRNYRNIVDNQWELLNRFYKACLNHGVFIHTMQHHGISSAHSDEDIDRALEGIETALLKIMAEGRGSIHKVENKGFFPEAEETGLFTDFRVDFPI